ncbi:hypothetical protein R3P38DRAFT_3043126 [Favolaschia claudopus]|uniref:Uncharacterized protein n=1 Tax=Favolaschia claudopus TaxID=2862362 RepID=A0AAW0A8A4_9AGAR
MTRCVYTRRTISQTLDLVFTQAVPSMLRIAETQARAAVVSLREHNFYLSLIGLPLSCLACRTRSKVGRSYPTPNSSLIYTPSFQIPTQSKLSSYTYTPSVGHNHLIPCSRVYDSLLCLWTLQALRPLHQYPAASYGPCRTSSLYIQLLFPSPPSPHLYLVSLILVLYGLYPPILKFYLTLSQCPYSPPLLHYTYYHVHPTLTSIILTMHVL